MTLRQSRRNLSESGGLRCMMALVLAGWVAAGLPASAGRTKYADRPLGDVLRELQTAWPARAPGVPRPSAC
jgi:hypothetical protein